jgi:geranylgeranyl diphosphate synthase type I
MHSAAEPDNLAAALGAAAGRFAGASPVTEQVRFHFADPDPRRHAGARRVMALLLAVAQAEGIRPAEALDAACAVAILHDSALVHADVDGDREPSVAARFGRAHGINAGDALCALAYLQVLDPPPARPPVRTVAMTRALHQANYALCAGTPGALAGAACELGALAAGCPPERAAAYGRLGRTYAAATESESDVRTAADRIAGAAGIDPAGTLRALLARTRQ